MKPVPALVSLMLLTGVLIGDHHQIITDNKTDFAGIRTFSIREGSARTTRPELNNKLIFKKVEEAIRAQLSAKGLTESSNRPDVIVGFSIGEDHPQGPSEAFDHGTLVIDLTARESNSTVWQGVYTDDETRPSKVAEKLPRNVEKLLSDYPPKKKK